VINNENCDFLIGFLDIEIWLSQLTSIWYRRSWIELEKGTYSSSLNKDILKEINNQLHSEFFYLSDFIGKYLKANMLNRRSDVTLNKLDVLKRAASFGLKIPSTVVTSRKSTLKKFLSSNEAISKNFSPGIFVKHEGVFLNGYTTKVTSEMILDLPDKFHPMLFQEYIEKAFELRCFYLNGDFYCSAIMSQVDEKTKIDFRNYNFEKPNRTPPFNLPPVLKSQLMDLLQILELNSGSIDLLVTPQGDFVFLEVNPIGQFSQVSKPCNYFLEKRIANSLIHNLHERKN
jgi:ATP-GRASP peptide maturase of grasp-with-spasm system